MPGAPDIIPSASLKHKQPNKDSGDKGNVIDMGLGNGKSINPHKKQRKEILKNIDHDVNQFM